MRNIIAALLLTAGMTAPALAEDTPSEDTKGAVELIRLSLQCPVPERTDDEYTTIIRNRYEPAFDRLTVERQGTISAISEVELYEVEKIHRLTVAYDGLGAASADGARVTLTCAAGRGACIEVVDRDPLMDCGGAVDEICEVSGTRSQDGLDVCDAETASNVVAAITHLIEVNRH